MRRQANFSYIFQIDTAISSLFYTYLCIYYTYLCDSQLPSALFNSRLCCHIDIEKGLAIEWSNPLLRVQQCLYADIFSMTRR